MSGSLIKNGRFSYRSSTRRIEYDGVSLSQHTSYRVRWRFSIAAHVVSSTMALLYPTIARVVSGTMALDCTLLSAF